MKRNETSPHVHLLSITCHGVRAVCLPVLCVHIPRTLALSLALPLALLAFHNNIGASPSLVHPTSSFHEYTHYTSIPFLSPSLFSSFVNNSFPFVSSIRLSGGTERHRPLTAREGQPECRMCPLCSETKVSVVPGRVKPSCGKLPGG